MSDQEPQDQNFAAESDELDVEELEDVAGGGGIAADDQISNTSCNGNCGC